MHANATRPQVKGMKAVLRWMASLMLLASMHAFAQTGTVTYVYTDPQGTPLAEADASGNITATFEYTPYGTFAPTGTSNPGQDPNGPGYTGHVNDPETNLVYMQARYYDPVTGHFLSTDPLRPVPGDAFNFNRYAYVNNNPIMGLDPTGMDDDCGPGCAFMRRLSNWYDGIGKGELSGGSTMPTRLYGNAQATVTYMNGEGNEEIAATYASAATVADAVPGVTIAACVSDGSCSTSDWVMGGVSAFGAVVPIEGVEADAAPFILKAVHGNSAVSEATAYLYRLTDAEGGLLKWGISKNPGRRYTQGFMLDKDMQIMASGSRREMLNLERWIVEHDPGVLNRERWAGAKAGEVP